jgi:hypothetical protein
VACALGLRPEQHQPIFCATLKEAVPYKAAQVLHKTIIQAFPAEAGLMSKLHPTMNLFNAFICFCILFFFLIWVADKIAAALINLLRQLRTLFKLVFWLLVAGILYAIWCHPVAAGESLSWLIDRVLALMGAIADL